MNVGCGGGGRRRGLFKAKAVNEVGSFERKDEEEGKGFLKEGKLTEGLGFRV